ncbi:hypothetical protein FOZ62_029692, partial [Perkinsus olseni]
MTVPESAATKKTREPADRQRPDSDAAASSSTAGVLRGLPPIEVPIPLTVRIPSFETKSALMGLNYTTYNIKVDDFGRPHSVNRRFDDFVKFHDHISSLPYHRREGGRRESEGLDQQPAAATLGSIRSPSGDPLIPALPPKQMFGSTLPAVVEERRPALELILHRATRRAEVLYFDTTDALWRLLELPPGCAAVCRFLTPSGQRSCQCMQDLSGLLDPGKEKEQYRLKHEAVLKCVLNVVDSEARGMISLPPAAFASVMDVLHFIVSDGSPERRHGSSKDPREMFVSEGGILTLLRVLAREGTADATANGDVVVLPRGKRTTPAAATDNNTATVRIDQVKRVLNGLIQASGEAFSTLLLHTLQAHDGIAVISEELLPVSKIHLHDTIAKLLWLSFDDDVQGCLLGHPRGLDLLGSLFASPFPSTRVICGLILATLASAERLDDVTLLSKIDSGLWQLLTTELLPSESLSSSARVPGAMLSSLTRTPGCLARVAQCLGGASSQTVKGFACWVLSGSSSSLRPDTQLSKTIVGAAEGLILQSKDLDPTINGLVAQLLLRFRKDGMRTLRSTPGECVAVDESLRSALHDHIVARRARNGQDAEQQESYLSSLVTECDARRDAVNKAVVPAEMN